MSQSWLNSMYLVKYLSEILQSSIQRARLTEKLRKHERVSDHRKPLHWLPIPARIQFKLMTTTWKALNDQAPQYIQLLLRRKPQQNHNLRSNSKLLLDEPISRNKNSFEGRAFSFAAPKLWSNLPDYVR